MATTNGGPAYRIVAVAWRNGTRERQYGAEVLGESYGEIYNDEDEAARVCADLNSTTPYQNTVRVDYTVEVVR